MLITNPEEIWRKITPEEKINAMNKSHTCGVCASFLLIAFASVMSIGLQIQLIFWISLLLSPIFFQFFSYHSWRDIKPRLILRYLAVRSVVRRFAFGVQAKNLEPELIFEGVIREVPVSQTDIDEISQVMQHEDTYPVWVALFLDTIIIFKESEGGGRLVFSATINDKLVYEFPEGIREKNYNEILDSEIKLQVIDKRTPSNIFYLSSKQPASFVVFAGKLNEIIYAMKNPTKVSLAENIPDRLLGK